MWPFVHFFHEGLAVGDNIGVSHDLEQLDLIECLLDLLLIHLRNVDDFHDVLPLALLRLNQHSVPETSLPHDLYLTVLVHSNYNLTIATILSQSTKETHI